MLARSRSSLINYMRLHNWKTAKQYSAEYGKTWTKQIIPRTAQDVQLYGWLHNYPYHNQNDLAWWATRTKPRYTLANYALRMESCSIFNSFLKEHEETVIHQLSLSGGTTLLLPTNAAFNSLENSQQYIEQLRLNSDMSRQFLLSHVILGQLRMRDVVDRCKGNKDGRKPPVAVKSVAGVSIPLHVSGSLEAEDREVKFGKSGRVLQHGIKCSNGVVFVLDGLVV